MGPQKAETRAMKRSNTEMPKPTGKVQRKSTAATQTLRVPAQTRAIIAEMKHRKDFLEKVKRNPMELKDSFYGDDKEVVLAAVTHHGYAPQYQHGKALQYASDTLKADKEIVLIAVTNLGGALEYASDALQADKDIVLAAVANYGDALHYAAFGGALQYASDALQADKEVVLSAVTNHGNALEHASKTLQADKNVVLAAVTTNSCALKHASSALQADREIVLAAVSAVNDWGSALEYASEALRADKEVVLVAVGNKQRQASSRAFRFASKTLRADKEVVLAAVTSNDVWMLKDASSELLDCSITGNLDFVRTVIQASSRFGVRRICCFPGLKDMLSTLFKKLKAISNKEILQLKNCGNALPPMFAEQLREKHWCLGLAFKKASASVDIQCHIREFSGVTGDIETEDMLLAYLPILCALQEKVNDAPGSWWKRLELFAKEANSSRMNRKQPD